MRLFNTGHKYGLLFNEKKETQLCSQIKVDWTDQWASCPDARGMGQINLVIPGAVLFTGTIFTVVHEWARVCNSQLPKKTQYYSVQLNYLFQIASGLQGKPTEPNTADQAGEG